MRRFELVLAFAAVFAVVWPAVFGIRPRRGIVSVGLVAALVAQLQIEGFRWQLIPLYVLSVGLAAGDVLYVDRSVTWTSRVARAVFGVAGVALAAALAVVLPVPELPPPPGPESVGTLTVQLVDTDRREVYGPRPGTPRTFKAQVWYPALSDGSQGDFELWSEDWDVVAPAVSRSIGFPSWFLNHTRFTKSHVVRSLQPVPGNFPVVVYSHGWMSSRSLAITQIEALASNGYIVIAPDHTYGAVATRLDEGEVIEYDPEALPEPEDVTATEYAEASQALLATYAADLTEILDQLDQGEDGRFAPIVANADLTRIGMFGHSTGGGAAVRVCLEDERCDAVLGMDPWVEPLPDDVIRVSATKPSLYMRSDEWAGNENDAVLRGIAGRSESVTYWIGIDGTAHSDFLVTPLISPLASQTGLKGPIAAGRIIPIINNYLVGFFDVFLLDVGPAALDAVTFEEVTVEVINP